MPTINGVINKVSRNSPIVINGGKAAAINGIRPHEYDKWRMAWNGNHFAPPDVGSVLYLPGVPGFGATIFDFSGQGNDGTVVGATWTRLPSGLWYQDFDGIDNIVNAGQDSSLFPVIGAWECWVNGATGSTQFLMSFDVAGQNAGDAVLYIISNKITFNIYDGADKDVIADSAIDGTSWYHVVANFGTGGMNMIVNGVLQADTDATTQAPVGNQDLCIGTYRPTPSNTLNGGLALVRIHSARLTEAAAASHYNQERHLFGE